MMLMIKTVTRSVFVSLVLGTVACGGGDDGGGDSKSQRNIEREDIPDSRFKPEGLENVIDELVVGIEDGSVPDEFAVGVVLKELQNFWRPVSWGASRAISELEVIGGVQGSTQEDLDVEESVQEQIEFVENQIELGVNALAIAPHNEDLIPYLEEFSESGGTMVTIDSDMKGIDRAIYIGTDNYQAGVTGGETLIDLLDGETGRVIVLGNTDPSWVGGFDRTNAAADMLEAAGNKVTILNSVWVPEDEAVQVAEAIAEDSDEPLVGMIGVFANAYALADAVVDADLDSQPIIVAFDSEQATLRYMEDGVIAATHAQRQYYMGYMSVYVMVAIEAMGLDATKDVLGAHLLDGYHLDTGLDVIRASDLEEYNAFQDELGIH
jgi:ribose transport system substrate-binding protein